MTARGRSWTGLWGPCTYIKWVARAREPSLTFWNFLKKERQSFKIELFVALRNEIQAYDQLKSISTQAYHRFTKNWIFHVLSIDIICFYWNGRVGIPTFASSSARFTTIICNCKNLWLETQKLVLNFSKETLNKENPIVLRQFP